MISEEEISENEEDPPSVSGMQVMDEVADLPNETLTPSALEDSLDMDQFEPILSGSSDIESEEDIDLQVSLNLLVIFRIFVMLYWPSNMFL